MEGNHDEEPSLQSKLNLRQQQMENLLDMTSSLKYQGPEEANRRVKKKFKTVDKDKKIVKDVHGKSR